MRIVAIVIPCYKDHQRISTTLASIQEAIEYLTMFSFQIILIDDGSGEINCDLFKAEVLDIHNLVHPVNRGQGAALQTGFEYCRRFVKPDLVITMDADGQHSGQDIPHLLAYLEESNSDIVFGNRFGSSQNIPRTRQYILKCAAKFEKWLTNLELQDAHNGFRVFNRRTLDILELTQDRMAHATEIKQLIAKYRLKYSEAPVTISYSPDNLQKGQKNSGSLLILRDLLKSYIFENN